MARRQTAPLELLEKAKAKLKSLQSSIGLEAVSMKVGRSTHTLKAGMYGGQAMGLELCEAILAIDSGVSSAPVEAPVLPAKVPHKNDRFIAKGTDVEKLPELSKPVNLSNWTGKLTNEQAKRIQAIAKFCAVKIAKGRDSLNGYSVDDLAQAAILRCVETAKRYDPSKGAFNTFFNHQAYGGIRDFIRESDVMSRGERQKAKEGKVESPVMLSMDDEEDGFELESSDPKYSKIHDEELLDTIIEKAHLTEKEATIIDMVRHDMSQRDVGDMFEFSESRASQVIMGIMEKLIKAKDQMIKRDERVRKPKPAEEPEVTMRSARPATIKQLPVAVKKEIEQQNKARRLMGLSTIEVKVRTCLDCQAQFESAGRRCCNDCKHENFPAYAGNEPL